METTIATTVDTLLPAVTDINGIEVFFYDVSQYNSNSANFFDSVAKLANTVIDAVLSCEKYFVWLNDIADTVYNSSDYPAWFGSALGLGMFFLVYRFIRN